MAGGSMAGAGTTTMACIGAGGAVAMKAGAGMADGTGMTAGAGMVAGITVGDRLRAAAMSPIKSPDKKARRFMRRASSIGVLSSADLSSSSWPLTGASVSTACDFGVIPEVLCSIVPPCKRSSHRGWRSGR